MSSKAKLTFRIRREHKTITVSVGGLLAAPPGHAHSVGNTSDQPARWLTIHTPDGGFATFMHGIRDGIEVKWDITPVPTDGGLPAHNATRSMSRNGIAQSSAG